MNWKRWSIFLVVVLIVLRLPALLHPVLDADEAIYGLFARIWFDGGLPYTACVETKPLGIYLLYGLIFSAFGKFNMIAVHAVTIGIVGLTAYVLFLIARRVYDERAGFFAALFYIVFSTTYIPKYIATTIEPVMLLFVALQFYFWIRFESGEKTRFAFLSGLFFSAACLFKYQAGMNLFILFVYLFIARPFILKRVEGQSVRGFLYFIFGGIWLPILMIAYLWKIGALDGFIYWNITGNADYISTGSQNIALMERVLTRVAPFVASTILLWVLALWQGAKVCRRSFRNNDDGFSSAHGMLILIWFALSIVPVSAGRRFYGHYFLLVVAPMSVLAGQTMSSLWETNRRWLKGLAIFWIVIPAVVFFVARCYISEIHRAVGEDTLADYRPIAEYVAERTNPSDRIVAWGFAPLVYWYSERLPATRFFWSDLLVDRVPGLEGAESSVRNGPMTKRAWEMFFEDIERNKPVYIVDTTPANMHGYRNFPIKKYSALADYVERNYVKEKELNGVIFYRRR